MSFRAILSLPSMVLLAACAGGAPPPPPVPGTTSAPPGMTVGGPSDAAFAIASAAPAARTSAAPAAVLAQGLKETSAWFASGMTAEGPAFTATLDAKGRAKAEVTLHAGTCYVIVGFSPDGKVADFDIRLWKTAKGSAPSLVAEDGDDDTTPTIGKPPICPDPDTPYLLELHADRGSGDVAVQLYAKAR